MCGGMIGLSHRLCIRTNFFQCRCKPFRITCEKSTGCICQKFPLARNGKLHECRNKRCKNGKRHPGNNHNELYSPVAVVSPPAMKREAKKKVRKQCHKPHKHYRDGGKKHVPIAEMRKLVRNNTFKLGAV